MNRCLADLRNRFLFRSRAREPQRGEIRQPRASAAKPWDASESDAKAQRAEIPESQTRHCSNEVSRPGGAFHVIARCHPGLIALGYRISPLLGPWHKERQAETACHAGSGLNGR